MKGETDMKYPAKLKKGDTVGIIAPSSGVSPERAKLCVEKLEEMGYKVKTADNLSSDLGGYMAGSGEVRGEWINRMFADPEVKAVICVRGGDGVARDMEYVDLDTVRRNPKIFVGYSDVTPWHLLFTKECGFVTFHGPMVSSNIADGMTPAEEKSFYDCINGDGEYVYRNPEGFKIRTLKEGRAEGELIGGNLSLISASMGTPYEMDAEGKIIFIEEVNERIDRLEKWSYQMRNAGLFKKCRGVLLGQFTNIDNVLPSYDHLALYSDVFEGYDFPVMYGLQSGHGEQNMTLPMGAVCAMDTSDMSIRFRIDR